MRTPRRFKTLGGWLTLAVLLLVAIATSCVTTTAIAVNVSAGPDPDSVAADVGAAAERIVMRHGLTAEPGGGAQSRCWGRRNVPESNGAETGLYLCETRKGDELQLRLTQVMAASLTPIGETIRRELVDSLRARFGANAVRECKWINNRDRTREGCPPVTGGGSG